MDKNAFWQRLCNTAPLNLMTKYAAKLRDYGKYMNKSNVTTSKLSYALWFVVVNIWFERYLIHNHGYDLASYY